MSGLVTSGLGGSELATSGFTGSGAAGAASLVFDGVSLASVAAPLASWIGFGLSSVAIGLFD